MTSEHVVEAFHCNTANIELELLAHWALENAIEGGIDLSGGGILERCRTCLHLLRRLTVSLVNRRNGRSISQNPIVELGPYGMRSTKSASSPIHLTLISTVVLA